MLAVNIEQHQERVDTRRTFTSFPIAFEIQPDQNLGKLLAELSPDKPWGDRQIAAKRIGQLRCSEALPTLLTTLPVDPFWMVRCAIIQALESIGDPGAIPTLRETAISDDFQVVRSYAAKAIERLSLEG